MKTNTKTKSSTTVSTKVVTQSLSYVSGKARAEGNIKRAKAVNGMSMEDCVSSLCYYLS